MVVDTSAIVAILRMEAEAEAFLQAISRADPSFMSAVSVEEASFVLAGRHGGPEAWRGLDAFLDRSEIEVVPFDHDLARRAREAFIRFGKGRHPAALNLGDCASYALAIARELPLLFKGHDFAMTDITPAVEPRPS